MTGFTISFFIVGVDYHLPYRTFKCKVRIIEMNRWRPVHIRLLSAVPDQPVNDNEIPAGAG